jgi:hypothetical protein
MMRKLAGLLKRRRYFRGVAAGNRLARRFASLSEFANWLEANRADAQGAPFVRGRWDAVDDEERALEKRVNGPSSGQVS